LARPRVLGAARVIVVQVG